MRVLILGIDNCMPCAGDSASIVPYILIGAAVLLVVGFIIFNKKNGKGE